MNDCFKISILSEICIKMRYFLSKNAKNLPSLGAPPLDPRPPPLRNPGYATGMLKQNYKFVTDCYYSHYFTGIKILISTL